jgi:hypothetical protein
LRSRKKYVFWHKDKLTFNYIYLQQQIRWPFSWQNIAKLRMDLGQRVTYRYDCNRGVQTTHLRQTANPAEWLWGGGTFFEPPALTMRWRQEPFGASPTNISKAVAMVTDRSHVPPIHPRVLVFWSGANFLR